jgi:uncharacterized membrane protein HdeD (DUF308 family)
MAFGRNDALRLPGRERTTLHDHWRLLTVEGFILLALGAAAVVVPQIATIATESIIGWLFLFSGVAGLWSTWRMRTVAGRWWSLLSAALGVATGLLLLRWPVSGALSLTAIVVAFFFIEGVASIMLAVDHRRIESGRWTWMAASGAIDLLLAALILSGFPGTAGWAIGLLVGVNLMVGGCALVGIGMRARQDLTVPVFGIPSAMR